MPMKYIITPRYCTVLLNEGDKALEFHTKELPSHADLGARE